MTSAERHELRYQRRRAKRYERLVKRNEEVGTVEEVFSFHVVFFIGKKCCNGVRWKQSIQNFELHLFSRTAVACRAVKSGRWKGKGYTHFLLRERGKIRPIDAPHVSDRQLHKVITQKILYPLYRPSMIHDNGASQKYMGLSFHFKVLKDDLHWYFRRYGRDGCIVLIDLKSFFPQCDQNFIYQRHDKMILDRRIRKITDQVIDDFSAYKKCHIGMPLGVEPSQIEMVALPSQTDNYAKCQLSLRSFAHYMDDYHALVRTREEGEKLIDALERSFKNQGLTINRRKCRIVPLTKAFKFCKATFKVTETGRIIVRGNRDSFKRTRHKIMSFESKIRTPEMTEKDIKEWYNSQTAYFRGYNDHNRILRLNRIAYNVIGGVKKCAA